MVLLTYLYCIAEKKASPDDSLELTSDTVQYYNHGSDAQLHLDSTFTNT